VISLCDIINHRGKRTSR